MGAPKAMKKAMTSGAIVSHVAEKTELKAKQVRAVFAELREVAYAEVAKTEKFTIPQLVMLKLKHKPARKAGTKMMFGKEVRVAKASQQGGQGLRRQEPEGLHLRCLSPLSTALCPLGPARQCCSWSCHAARFVQV